MALPNKDSLTLALPRISAPRFKELLKTKNSPAVVESDEVFEILIAQSVDPSFALAQFRVESQYGTAGFAEETGSWGNMLHDPNLTKLESGILTKIVDGRTYVYATYQHYKDAITDYCRYLHWYKDKYGLDTIYEATARWIGRTPGSSGHLNYVNVIVSDMIEYEYPQGGYESGDKLIYFGEAFDRTTGKIGQKYPVTYGLELYRGTDGDLLKKYTGTAGNAWWLGLVNGNASWGAIVIGTSSADADATVVYIKNPDVSKVVNV